MIIVKLGNRTLGITFQYEVIKPSLENPDAVRRTWCELHRLGPDGKTEAIVARAGGRCSPSEPGGFRYEKGRKLGLARALKQYGLTRPERTKVWLAYHERPRPKSVQPVKVQPPAVHLTEGPQQADGYKEPDTARQALLQDQADAEYPSRAWGALDLNAGEVH